MNWLRTWWERHRISGGAVADLLYEPGSVRIIHRPVRRGQYVVSHDVYIEVMQQDGTWQPLRGVTRVAVTLGVGKLGEISLHVYLTDLAIYAKQDQVTLRALPMPPGLNAEGAVEGSAG